MAYRGPINFVTDVGASNAGVDCAAAWAQALLDISKNVGGIRYCNRPLIIPPGWYRATGGFKAVGYKNLTIIGAGATDPGAPSQDASMTVLQNIGASTAVFELDGCAQAAISGLSLIADDANPPAQAFYSHWNPVNTALGSTRNVFSDITVSGKYVTGFRIGGDGSYYDPWQVDQHTFYSCRAFGLWNPGENTYWQSGFRFGSGVQANNLIHKCYDLSAYQFAYGVRIAATGPVSLIGGCLQTNGWDIYSGNQNGPLYVHGMRSEVGRYGFLFHSSAQSAPMPVRITDCEYSGDSSLADNGYGYPAPIWCDGPGPILIDEFRCFKYGAGVKPRVFVRGGKRITVVLRGLQFQNTEMTELVKTDLAGDVASYVKIEDYTRTNDDFTALEQIPGPYYVNGNGKLTTRTKAVPGGVETFSLRSNRLKLSGVAGPPATPNIAVFGTPGSTFREYCIVFKDARGRRSLPSAIVSVANSATTLTATDYVRLTSSDNQYDLEPVFVDVLRRDSGVWRALFKDMPVTEWYGSAMDKGQALEDSTPVTLPTRDEMADVTIEGAIDHDGDLIGLNGAPPVAKGNITGSRAVPEQALKSLLDFLALRGDITNGTTA